ncbi:type II toxin-antitoxin system RelE family toxin [Nocardia carnea]|uniref:type II toxin-antitoxin system RelE family toxin n=1 Tax=Nocardia carnea TaxID=37328 RepID=UPI0024556CE7|nr:type II toxin-antitoxin system RelE/ParE family toxin [Nocardia carnea]
MSWSIHYKPAARRALTETLPEAVAVAALELIEGDLRQEPFRVGKPLEEPFEGLHSARRGTYRIIYRIVADRGVIEIHSIRHRRDVYRF